MRLAFMVVVTLVTNNLSLNMITYSFSVSWESAYLVPGIYRFLSAKGEKSNLFVNVMDWPCEFVCYAEIISWGK